MGRAAALLFAREGASIVASGRDEARGRSLVGEILAAGGRAEFVPGDVSLPETNARLVERCSRAFGRRRYDSRLRRDARPRFHHRCAARHVAADDGRQSGCRVLSAALGPAGDEGPGRRLSGDRRFDRRAEGVPESCGLLRLQGRAARPGPAGGHRLRSRHSHQRVVPRPCGHAAHLGFGRGVSRSGARRVRRRAEDAHEDGWDRRTTSPARHCSWLPRSPAG